MCSPQQTNQAWDRFKDRARDLKTQRTKDCACPPNDWTVNLSPKPTS